SVQLPPHRAELTLDRRVDVLVLGAGRRDPREALLDRAELVGGEQPGVVQAPRVLGRRLQVVRQQLLVVGAEELPDGRRETALDPAAPERHTAACLRFRAAASSPSSPAILMKPSDASCGKVSPVAYEESFSAYSACSERRPST